MHWFQWLFVLEILDDRRPALSVFIRREIKSGVRQFSVGLPKEKNGNGILNPGKFTNRN
jgi:hypothetical protein